jgi:hypothetical protein
VSPTSRYRGLENQLYRVEIHHGWRARDREEPEREEEREEERGEARRAEHREARREGREEEREEGEWGEGREGREEGESREEHEEEEREWAEAEEEEEEEEREGRHERQGAPRRGPTFKWSRENASVIFPIRSIDGTKVTLDHLGHDERLGLHVGDWVEVIDDVYDLHRRADDLLRITAPPDPVKMQVTLNRAPTAGKQTRHPFFSAMTTVTFFVAGRFRSWKTAGLTSRTASRCASSPAVAIAPAITG